VKFFVWAIIAWLLLALLTLGILFAPTQIEAIEIEWVKATIALRQSGLTIIVQLVTFVTSAVFCAVAMALLSLWEVWRATRTFNPLHWLRDWQRVLPALWPGWMFGAAILSNIALRIAVGRLPPEVEYVGTLLPEIYAGFHQFSFPSGHAGTAMVTYLALASVVPARSKTLALVVALALILGTGWGRVYLGVHWPSDVLAGYLLGLGWFMLGQEWTHRRRDAQYARLG